MVMEVGESTHVPRRGKSRRDMGVWRVRVDEDRDLTPETP